MFVLYLVCQLAVSWQKGSCLAISGSCHSQVYLVPSMLDMPLALEFTSMGKVAHPYGHKTVLPREALQVLETQLEKHMCNSSLGVHCITYHVRVMLWLRNHCDRLIACDGVMSTLHLGVACTGLSACCDVAYCQTDCRRYSLAPHSSEDPVVMCCDAQDTLEVLHFLQPSRQHIKEGLLPDCSKSLLGGAQGFEDISYLSSSQGMNSNSLHFSPEVVKALIGEPLTEEDLLKVCVKPLQCHSLPTASIPDVVRQHFYQNGFSTKAKGHHVS